MAETRDIFDALAPTYASISSDTFDVFIGLAGKKLDASEWGPHYQEAACLLAAHQLALRDRAQNMGASAGGAGGELTSVSEGDQSLGFEGVSGAADTIADATLATTTFGQQYIDLRDRIFSGPYSSE